MKDFYPLHLFPQHDMFADLDSKDDGVFLQACAKVVLKYLWQNWTSETLPKSLFAPSVIELIRHKHARLATILSALITERDPFLIKAVRLEIQTAFDNLQQQLVSEPPKTENQQLSLKLAIHNMLSIYTMFSPTPYEKVTFPQFIDGQWQAVEFNITPIEMTPSKGVWVNFIGDRDRLFSYGLTPNNHPGAQPVLMHCGTGWPTAQGSTIQIAADIWPGKTPGEVFFEWQHEAISTWLDRQQGKVITAGQSLGGACAMLTAMFKPDKIDNAYCLVPPGLDHHYGKAHPLFGKWYSMTQKDKPTVYIQKQKLDPISQFGIFPDDFILVRVKVYEDAKCSLPMKLLSSHARSFTTCDHHEIEIGSMDYENKTEVRKKKNMYLYRHARPLAFYGFIMPYFFLFKQPRLWAANNALLILLTLLLTGTFIALPAIPFFSSVILNAFVTGYIASYISCKLLNIFSLPDYFKELKSLPKVEAVTKAFYDIINLASFGVIGTTMKVGRFLFYNLPNFFSREQPSQATIHTEALHNKTEDLNNHHKPSLFDKFQTWALIILVYTIAIPVKLLCYELPQAISKFISTMWSKDVSQEDAPSTQPDSKPTTEASAKDIIIDIGDFDKTTGKKPTVQPEDQYLIGGCISCFFTCSPTVSNDNDLGNHQSPSL